MFVFLQPAYNDVGADYPEVEYFDVRLMKDSQGLGITIAGYVGKDNTPGTLIIVQKGAWYGRVIGWCLH